MSFQRRLTSVPKEYKPNESNNDFAFCQRLASQISNAQDLPAVCYGFPSLMDSAKRNQPYRSSAQSTTTTTNESTMNPIHIPPGMARTRIYRRDTTPNPTHVPRGMAFTRLFRQEMATGPPTAA